MSQWFSQCYERKAMTACQQCLQQVASFQALFEKYWRMSKGAKHRPFFILNALKLLQ